MKKVAIITYGCKINQYESACITDSFSKEGYTPSSLNQADVIVINTCTVTNRTDFKSRNAIRKALILKAEKPDLIIIVTGCYAQRNREQILSMGAVDLVIDNNSKYTIPQILQKQDYVFTDIMESKFFAELSTDSMPERNRAILKIQDGCDCYCSYCAVPYARGHSRSREKEAVLAQVHQLTDQGYCEFIISGINLGLYGKEKNDNYYLADLLQDIEKVEAVRHIRISSLEPQLFEQEVLSYMRTSSKLCPHLHIPLQSGSDTILQKMHRRYDTYYFKKLVQQLNLLIPHLALGLDVIVGFPGETNESFEETYSFLQSLPFTYLHVFIYSKRPGTEAINFPNPVHGSVAKERSARLLALSRKKEFDYLQYTIKYSVPQSVVLENQDGDYMVGTSNHYLRVYLPATELHINQLVHCIPIEPYKDGLLAKVSDD